MWDSFINAGNFRVATLPYPTLQTCILLVQKSTTLGGVGLNYVPASVCRFYTILHVQLLVVYTTPG